MRSQQGTRKIKKAHPKMRLNTSCVPGRSDSFLSSRLLIALGIDTVCYASPTLNTAKKVPQRNMRDLKFFIPIHFRGRTLTALQMH